MKKIYIILGIVALVLIAGGVFIAQRMNIAPPEPAVRTLNEPVIIERTSARDSLAVIRNTGYKFYQMGNNGSIGAEVGIKHGYLNVASNNGQMAFYAIGDSDTMIVAERWMPAEEAHNIRDIGGLFTKDGYQLKWGKVFRADELASLNKEDFKLLAPLQIQTIIDFRTSAEIEEKPDTWPDLASIDHVELSIMTDTIADKSEWLEKLKSDNFNGDSLLYMANRGFVEEFSDKYKQFFEMLLGGEMEYPVMYHCTGGKDRTGFATFLILLALGVDEQTAIDEYLMTNYYTHGKNEDMLKMAAAFYGIDPVKLRSLAGVKKEFIQGALDAISDHYGTVDNFLCEALNVCEAEKEQLKTMLLYGYETAQVD
ncbi:tyrosine-protein phosphatase [Roseivirga pacifica]|uniref:tyrosine-protein phosphatase n=1 Tax=Roseivirga pacifica TaxID=1267423 RepID=UPI003BB1AC1C